MRIRVYIAIILLLLLLIVSQVCASDASRLSKEPTYKIWAFNSINKVTKVTIIGSGPGCPYGLNPDGWSKTIALKRLCLLLCIFVSQNSPNHIMLKKNCQVPLHPQHVESNLPTTVQGLFGRKEIWHTNLDFHVNLWYDYRYTKEMCVNTQKLLYLVNGINTERTYLIW